MKKLDFNKKVLILFASLLVVGITVFSLGYAFFGNVPMRIDEYVKDNLLTFGGGNAYLESNMFWGTLVVFLIIVSIINFFFKSNTAVKSEEKVSESDLLIYFLIISNVIFFIYSGGTRPELLLIFITVGIIDRFIDKDKIVENIIKYTLFSIFSCFVAYCFCTVEVDTKKVMIFTAITYILFCYFFKNKDSSKVFKVFQCIYPLAILIYLKNQYENLGKIYTINHPLSVIIFFYLLISVLILCNIFYIKKEWNSKTFSVGTATCMSTAIIFAFTDSGRFIFDAHHLAEDVITFNQVFLYHKIPYVNTFPVSGAFPLMVGFVENVLSIGINGANMAISIFNIFVCITTVLLLTRYLDNRQILCLTLLFPFTNLYIRTGFMLIYVLILFLPKLRNKSGYWLETFFISSCAVVFFYPVFGTACVFGVLPLALINLYKFFFKKEYKNYFREKKFTVIFVCELIMGVLLLPSIIGLIKHVLLYTDKGTLANAFPTFGQKPEEIFLSYLPEGMEFLRRALWYSLRYVVPIIFIVFFFYILLRVCRSDEEGSLVDKYTETGKWCFAGAVILTVCCTLTTKRQDPYNFLMRTGYVLFPTIAVIFYILYSKYMKKTVASMLFLVFFFSMYMIDVKLTPRIILNGFSKVEKKDYTYGYISEEDSRMFPNLGEGFARRNGIENLRSETSYAPANFLWNLKQYKRSSDKFLSYDKDISFFGLDMAYIEALKLKASEQPSPMPIMTYKISKYEMDKMRKNNTVIYVEQILPEKLHNIYKFLLTSDEYVYSAEDEAFVPKALADKMGLRGDDKKLGFGEVTNLYEDAAALGKSFEILKENYTKTDVKETIIENMSDGKASSPDRVAKMSEINVEFDREIAGTEGDCIYLELKRENKDTSNLNDIESPLLKYFTQESINKKCIVSVSWEGEPGRANFINCRMSDGRLFIPIGVNVNWMLNKHKGFKIRVFGLDEGEKFSLKRFEIMKSRDL